MDSIVSMAFSSGDKVVWGRKNNESIDGKAHSKQTWAKNKLSKTYMFQVSSLKPAQDPWQLIHSGEGRTLNPHRLEK